MLRLWGGDRGCQCPELPHSNPPPSTRCPSGPTVIWAEVSPPPPSPSPLQPHGERVPHPPPPKAPSPSHLFLLLFGFGDRREGAEVGDGPIDPPAPPLLPPPHLMKGGAIAGSRCHQCPERFQLSWGDMKGGGE